MSCVFEPLSPNLSKWRRDSYLLGLRITIDHKAEPGNGNVDVSGCYDTGALLLVLKVFKMAFWRIPFCAVSLRERWFLLLFSDRLEGTWPVPVKTRNCSEGAGFGFQEQGSEAAEAGAMLSGLPLW